MNHDHRATRRARASHHVFSLASAILLAACGDSEATRLTKAAAALSPDDAAAGAAADDTVVDRDSQVVDVLVTANAGEVEQGAIAQAKAQDPAVREFARMMVSDHGAAIEELLALAGRKGIPPEDNVVSEALEREATFLTSKFAPLSGAAFDRAYMDVQIIMHRTVLTIIDEVLMPAVHDEDVATLLVSMRATVADHLEHAQGIRAALEEGTAQTTHRSAHRRVADRPSSAAAAR